MKFEEHIRSFFSSYPKKTYLKHTLILQPDTLINTIYFISKGVIRSYGLTEDGRELTMNLFKPLTFFPIVTQFSGKSNYFYFESITPAVLYQAPADEVMNFLKKNHHILFDLTKRISIGLEGFTIRTFFLLSSHAREKTAGTLLMLAKRFGEQKTDGVVLSLPITHELFASLSGMTRETATIELNKLEKEGIIEIRKKLIRIYDMTKLETIALFTSNSTNPPYSF